MKTLVLDRQYQPIRFISYKKLAKFITNDKVDIISWWDDVFYYNTQLYPSIVKLKDYIRKKPRIPRFNSKALFIRDNYICQYTGFRVPSSKLTVDHVIPQAQGGVTNWDNCVTASLEINLYKGNRTPEEAGLVLLSKPKPPAQQIFLEFESLKHKHQDWYDYFVSVDS